METVGKSVNNLKIVTFKNEYQYLKTNKIFPSYIKPISEDFLEQMNERKSGLFLPSWGVFRLHKNSFEPMKINFYFDPCIRCLLIKMREACFLDNYKGLEENVFTRGFIKNYESLENFFREKYEEIYGVGTHSYEVTYKWKFEGLIPVRTKERILLTRELFDDTYLVSDISEIEPSIIVSPKDPLLIGRQKKSFYLIDKFDCLPAEEYVSREFTF